MSKKKIISFFSLIASDFLAILSSFLLAFVVRESILPSLYPLVLERPAFFGLYLKQSYMFILWVAVFLYERLYTKRYSIWDETRLLLKSTTIAFSLVMIAVFLTREYFYFSRLIIILAWLFSLVLLPVFRYAAKRALIRRSFWEKKVVIVGTGASSLSLTEAIQQNKTMGYRIVGCLSEEPGRKGETLSGVLILGHIDEIAEWKRQTGFEDIIVSLPDFPAERVVELLKSWEQISETIRYIPRTGDLITAGVEIENIGKHLALAVRKNLEKPWNVLIKEVFEFLLSLFLTVLLLPFFLVIALAIKIDSRGPVFFIQERYGQRGKKLKLIKFRSMFKDAGKRLENYLKENAEARGEWERYKKLKSYDPRITRMGRILRKYSLDELPQLFNVLRREMNVVGPRPYIMEELREVESIKSILLRVKPGMTGLWQISGRSKLLFRERLNLDEYYIRNWSLWLDIVILLKTLKVFLSGEGAY